jgi:hypothetical protein
VSDLITDTAYRYTARDCVAYVAKRRTTRVEPMWTGNFLTEYVKGVPMTEFNRWDYAPIFTSVLYVPICIAIAGIRMQRKQMQ